MGTKLDAKQTIALANDDRELIRTEARSRGIGNGLLARACLRYGLDRLDEQGLQDLIREEREAEMQRISEAARQNIRQRWHMDEEA